MKEDKQQKRAQSDEQHQRKSIHTVFKQAGLQHLFTNFLPEVRALYTFSPPHPPTQMISFQQRSSMQKKNKTPFLIWSILKIIFFGAEQMMSSLHLCTTQLFQLQFLLLFGTKVNNFTKPQCSFVCYIYSTITAYFSSFQHLLFQRMN